MDQFGTVSADAFYQGKAYGSVASRLLANGMDVRALRPYIGNDGRAYTTLTVNGKAVAMPLTTNAATLRKDEWVEYDKTVIKTVRDRLVGVNDLVQRGLTYTIGNGMGTTVLQYEDMNDPGTAHVSMDGATRGENDRPEYVMNYLPLPITHSDFQLNARVLAASRNGSMPLDTTNSESAARRVAEKLEDMLFTATTFTYGGGTIYSYLNHPHINPVTLGTHWDSSSKSGANILTDVEGMMEASIEAGFYGPWVLYVPKGYQVVLGQDYTTGYPKTIRQRLLELENLEAIKIADRLTAHKVVLVQMTADVVRMVIGMGITPVEWETEGGMIIRMKVMTIQVPQIRSDQNGNCGVTVLA